MSKKTQYTDEPISLGERVDDFLPPPHELVPSSDTVKITLNLNRESLDFFKRTSREQGVPYQRMIRALIDAYAEKHTDA